MQFDDWFSELLDLCTSGGSRIRVEMDRNYYNELFNQGMSPEDAYYS